MNGSSVRRFAWKEYRVLRGFWTSLALMAIVGQLFVLLFLHETTLLAGLFGVALIAVALYALGNGATMFATEREEETYDLLRVLPVTERQVVLGKFAFSVTSVIAIAVLLLMSAWVLADWRVPAPESHRQLWATFGLGALELLVWGVFFSLLSSRPLQAAILGVVATSASVSALVYLDGNGRSIHTLPVYVNVVPMRLVMVAVMAAIDLGLALRWLRPRSQKKRSGETFLARWWSRERDEIVASTTTSNRASLKGLTWHAWRQSRLVFAWILLGVLLLGALVWDPTSVSYIRVVVLAGACLIGSTVFLGDQERHQYRFFAEHGVSGRRVWLSRQIVGLAVIVVFATIVAAVVSMTGFDPFNLMRGHGSRYGELWQEFVSWAEFTGLFAVNYVTVALGFLLAYASGQFFSMLLRNGLLAGFFGLLFTVPIYASASLMIHVGFSPVWSVAPVPVVLLLATWLRAPDWISGRNTWRGWLRVALAAVVPLVGVAAAAALTRVYEIPRVHVGFDVQEYARPRTEEERETASIYREAGALLKPYDRTKGGETLSPIWYWNEYSNTPLKEHLLKLLNTPLGERELKWLNENKKPLAMTRKASIRDACILSGPGTRDDRRMEGVVDWGLMRRMGALAALLIISGGEREERQDLAGALDDYLAALRMANHLRHKGNWHYHSEARGIENAALARLSAWGSRKGQSPDLIRHALASLNLLDTQRPTSLEAIKSDYLFARRLCSGDMDALQDASLSEDEVRSLVFVSRLAPWELARSRRLLDYVTNYEMQMASHVVELLQSGRPPSPRLRHWLLEASGLFDEHYHSNMYVSTSAGLERLGLNRRTEFWVSTTPRVEHAVSPYLHSFFRWSYLFRQAAQRRAVRVVLAAQLWRMEFGELPRSLDELVGETLESLPVDPLTGEPFRYFPDGVPESSTLR